MWLFLPILLEKFLAKHSKLDQCLRFSVFDNNIFENTEMSFWHNET